MEVLTRNDLNVLMQERPGKCVSIFMPSHRRGDTQQDPIRFKNLLRKAEEMLIESGQKPTEARALLDPAMRVVKNVFFREHQSEGFALFIAPETFLYFRLPVAFPELVVVNDRFYVKPLLKVFAPGGKFYLLSLSQDTVRLYQGNKFSLTEMKLHDIPDSLATALRYDTHEKLAVVQGTAKSNAARSVRGVRGINALTQTGHGSGVDDHYPELFRYFRQIDRGLHRFFGGETAPLVLAGVEYLLPLYRDANTYPYLVPEAVTGNPERISDGELHEKAWDMVEPYLARAQSAALDRYRRLSVGTSSPATSDIVRILLAAWGGRVDTLFVLPDVPIWGSFEPAAGEVIVRDHEEPGDEDLVDRATVLTLMHSGKVYSLEPAEMPDKTPVAAILRY